MAVFPSAHAHPSVGIVIGPAGDVFYSDLERVWRITPNGQKEVALANVHTHELAIDASGALLGEDSKWLGGDRYRHRIWRRAPDGKVTDVVPWTDGFWPEYGLTGDASGAMYWVKCAARSCAIWKRDRSGRVSSISPPRAFRMPVNRIAASPAGDVYVIDGPDLRRVGRHGKVETIARLSTRTDNRHELMGITLDGAGNIYVAAHGMRTVFRVSASGKVQRVARSTPPWAPSGVAVSSSGELWILEWAGTKSRVRRVALARTR